MSADGLGDESGDKTDDPEVFPFDIKTGEEDQDGNDAPVNDLEPDIRPVQFLQDGMKQSLESRNADRTVSQKAGQDSRQKELGLAGSRRFQAAPIASAI